MIVKNEASLLADCLASATWADEIVVLDSGSEDETVALAEQYGAKVYNNTEWPGYGKQRQLAQQYATGDYILMLDADERVTPELKSAIETVLLAPEEGAVYSCARRNLFLGRFMRHSGWYPDRVTRLYPRDQYRYNDDLVHESLDSGSAKVIPLAGDLLHLTCRDFLPFNENNSTMLRLGRISAINKVKVAVILRLSAILSGHSVRHGYYVPASSMVNKGYC